MLETVWRGTGLDKEFEDAAEKIVEEAGRRKSSLMNDVKRRGSVMVDGLKSKAVWAIENNDPL